MFQTILHYLLSSVECLLISLILSHCLPQCSVLPNWWECLLKSLKVSRQPKISRWKHDPSLSQQQVHCVNLSSYRFSLQMNQISLGSCRHQRHRRFKAMFFPVIPLFVMRTICCLYNDTKGIMKHHLKTSWSFCWLKCVHACNSICFCLKQAVLYIDYVFNLTHLVSCSCSWK